MTSSGVGFAVLEGVLYRFFDGGLQAVTLSGLQAGESGYSVLPTGPTSGLLTTNNGKVYEFTLGQPVIERTEFAGPYSLFSSSAGDLWASDLSSQLVRSASPTSWPSVSLPYGENGVINGFAPTGAQEGIGWFSDELGAQVLQSYSSGWTLVPGLNGAGVNCLWGDEPGRVYTTFDDATVARVSPSGLTPVLTTPNDFACVAAETGGQLFGYGNGVFVSSGGTWVKVLSLPTNRFLSSLSVLGGDGLTCGPNELYTSSGSDGGTWVSALSATVDSLEFDAPLQVLVRADGSAYVLTNSAAFLLDEVANAKVSALGGTSGQVRYMSQLGPNDYIARFANGFRRFDGSTVSAVMPSTFPPSSFFSYQLAAESPSSAWAVGFTGSSSTDASVAYWDGGTWALVPPPIPSSQVRAVASFGGTTWVSISDRVYRRDGNAWLDLGGAGVQFILELQPLGADRVLACGSTGIARSSHDGGWTRENSLGCTSLSTDPIAGTAIATTYSVQPLLRSDAGVWTSMTMPTNMYLLNSRIGIRGTRAWLVGDNASVLIKR
ncbi:MAG: hypothetical protein JNG84_07540 [Archangium sp.]|nr:hypothetical protein [Archangium sp.]